MTRLKTEDLREIGKMLPRYDRELLWKTRCNLREVACRAAGLEEKAFLSALPGLKAAVVPIQGGQGIIEGFTLTVGEILHHIGLPAFVTRQPDVAGLAEAIENGAPFIFLADDRQFVALNLACRTVVDNARATGKGFTTALSLMVSGLEGKPVLVLGCGPVGQEAVKTLFGLGAQVAVYDIVPAKSRGLAEISLSLLNREIQVIEDIQQALAEYRFIIDATDAAEVIPEAVITDDTYIAAPGMPLGLGLEAYERVFPRLIHDPLTLGVATMAADLVNQVLSGRHG